LREDIHNADHTRAHNDLCKGVLDYLSVVCQAFAWKTWGGGYELSGRADVLACLRGRFVAVEVKTGKAKPSKAQQKFREAVEKAGGLYILCRRLEDVEAGLLTAGLIEKSYL